MHASRTSQSSTSMSCTCNMLLSTVGIITMAVCILLLVAIILSLHQSTSFTIYHDSTPADINYPVGEPIKWPHDSNRGIGETDLPPLNHDVPFVGRDREVAEISSYLQSDTVYVIGIHGPPAFGKSTLAFQVGWEVVRLGISVRYVDVSERRFFKQYSMEDANIIKGIQARTDHMLARTEQTIYWRKDTDLTLCQDRNNLCNDLMLWAGALTYKHVLILDNCDGILTQGKREKFLDMIKALFQRSAHHHLSIILTSQAKVSFLDLRHVTYHLPGLTNKASLVLLQTIASEKRNLTKEEGEKVAMLVGKCPLALKVVAVTMRDYPGKSVLPIIDRLERNVLKAISSRTLSAVDRFEKVMDSAYSYLSMEVKQCANYVHAFPGSFDELSGITILDACGVEGQECLEVLESRSLIERYWLETEFRYQLHRLIKEYFSLHTFGELTPFDPVFQEHYTTMFLELYSKRESTEATDFPSTHKFSVEIPNLEHLFMVLHNDLSHDLICEEGVAVLAFGYINQHIHFHDNNVFRNELFNCLRRYKQFLAIVLGEVNYNSIYADLLEKLYNSKCKLQYHHEECSCAELCTNALTLISMWHLDGLNLSINCLICIVFLITQNLIYFIGLAIGFFGTLLTFVYAYSTALLKLLDFVFTDFMFHKLLPVLSSMLITLMEHMKIVPGNCSFTALIVASCLHQWGMHRRVVRQSLISLVTVQLLAACTFDSMYLSFVYTSTVLGTMSSVLLLSILLIIIPQMALFLGEYCHPVLFVSMLFRDTVLFHFDMEPIWTMIIVVPTSILCAFYGLIFLLPYSFSNVFFVGMLSGFWIVCALRIG